MQVSDKNMQKLAFAMTGLFFLYALWEQFVPSAAPGVAQFAQANLLAKSDNPADQQKACKLYAEAVREGNREAVFNLSDCIGKNREDTREARMLRYAVLTMVVPDILRPDIKPVKSTRNPTAERDALGLTPEEAAKAKKINVIEVLNGEVSPWDYAFRAW